jgi:hypothetical protein
LDRNASSLSASASSWRAVLNPTTSVPATAIVDLSTKKGTLCPKAEFDDRAEAAADRNDPEEGNAQRVASFCTAWVLDHSETGGTIYLVTEFIEGVSLADQVTAAGAGHRHRLCQRRFF